MFDNIKENERFLKTHEKNPCFGWKQQEWNSMLPSRLCFVLQFLYYNNVTNILFIFSFTKYLIREYKKFIKYFLKILIDGTIFF